MYMVVYKCTRSERDGIGYTPEHAEPLDCYMVANEMFETRREAKICAEVMPLSRQPRVVSVTDFRCPKSGEWKKRELSYFQLYGIAEIVLDFFDVGSATIDESRWDRMIEALAIEVEEHVL